MVQMMGGGDPAVWEQGVGTYRHITCSADGAKLAAIINTDYIYKSVDYGNTWTQHTELGLKPWLSITLAGNGNNLIAVPHMQNLCISSNFGNSWSQISSTISKPFAVASSENGNTLIVVGGWYSIAGTQSSYQNVAVSYNAGSSWVRPISQGSVENGAVAISNNGTKMLIARSAIWAWTTNYPAGWVSSKGNLIISSDSGITWQTTSAILGHGLVLMFLAMVIL